MFVCGISVPQMRQFCLFTYRPRSKWASFEKMIFLPKSASSVSRSVAILPSVVQAYTQPYSFGGRIKLIICQIRHELSVTIHEIRTSCKKTLDGGSYIFRNCNHIPYYYMCAIHLQQYVVQVLESIFNVFISYVDGILKIICTRFSSSICFNFILKYFSCIWSFQLKCRGLF